MWRRVDLMWTDVSEEHIAPIFRVEKSASVEPAWAGGCSDTFFRNVGSHMIYTAQHPRRQHSSEALHVAPSVDASWQLYWQLQLDCRQLLLSLSMLQSINIEKTAFCPFTVFMYSAWLSHQRLFQCRTWAQITRFSRSPINFNICKGWPLTYSFSYPYRCPIFSNVTCSSSHLC
jgi:hypothetical protein